MVLTGTITNLANYCKYIPNPIFNFDLQVFRRKKKTEEEPKYDLVRIIVFNDEEFNEKYKNGDRIKVIGELQSRNYTINNNEVPEHIEKAVANYVDLFERFPCKQKPINKKREVIEWSYLIDTGLMPSVPKDSLYIENGSKSNNARDKYVYSIDKDMILHKEKQHVAYEVIVENKYEKLTEPLNIHIGDLNTVELTGRVTKKNSYKNSSNMNISNFNIRTESVILPKRVFNNHAFLWEDEKLSKSKDIQIGHFISLKGRLQSRDYTKLIRIRKKTSSGLIKRLDIPRTFTTREVSISSFSIL